MIPVKGCTYLIQYVNFFEPHTSYYGPGTFTGIIEEDSDEPDPSRGILYEFTNLETTTNHLCKKGLFSKEDILKKINN